MRKTLLFVGGAGILGYALYRYFKVQSKLLLQYDYKIAGIKVKKFTLNELSIDLSIKFISKSDIEAKINKIFLNIFLEGKKVGFITETKEFVIPARGSSIVPLLISINPQLVFRNITDIALGIGRARDVRFGLDGFADIKSGFISTTIPIKYETTLKEYLKG